MEIFPFFRERRFLCRAKDSIFCVTEVGDGYGEVEGLILFIFSDSDAEVTSGGGCPLVRLLLISATIFPPEGNDLF